MSLSNRIKLVRANYSVKFTLPILYTQHQDELAEALKSIPEEEHEAFRKDFIERKHELKLVVSRLSDEEQKRAKRLAGKAMEQNQKSVMAYLEEYQADMWPKIRRHCEKALEKGEDGTFTEVGKDVMNEYLDTVEKYAVDEKIFIIGAYNDAEEADRKKAEGDKDFLAPSS